MKYGRAINYCLIGYLPEIVLKIFYTSAVHDRYCYLLIQHNIILLCSNFQYNICLLFIYIGVCIMYRFNRCV